MKQLALCNDTPTLYVKCLVVSLNDIRVVVYGCFVEWLPVLSGVPQGPVVYFVCDDELFLAPIVSFVC